MPKKKKPTRGGRRPGAGRPPSKAPLSCSLTVALTPETMGAIDAELERLRKEQPGTAWRRPAWVRSLIVRELERRS